MFLRLIILFLFVANSVFAQTEINLEKVQSEGLTNFYIKCIRQDKNGFLWFGTEEGLFRYDGYSFVQAKNINSNQEIPGINTIEFIYTEKDEFIWVGSRGGLRCVDIDNMTIRDFPASETFTVYSMIPKNDSVFFVGTSAGLYLFNKNGKTWNRINAVEKNIFIRSLYRDAQNRIFIAAHSGLYCYDEKNNTCNRFELPTSFFSKNNSQIAHRTLPGANGNLWITTWNSGLLEFDTRKMEFIGAYPSNTCFDLQETEDGNILLANSESGVTVFDQKKKSFISHPVQWEDDDQARDRVYALFTDKAGTTWIGTENGIYKNDPHHIRFSTLNFIPDKKKSIPIGDLSPLTIHCDKQNFWWLGTYRGLLLLDINTGVVEEFNKQLNLPLSPFNVVVNLMDDSSGNMWLTARHRLIHVQISKNVDRPVIKSQTFTTPVLKSTISKAFIDSKKRIWLGTHSDGIFLFDPTDNSFTSYNATDTNTLINKNEIRAIFELDDKYILTGGEHTGLWRLDPQTHHHERLKLFEKIANSDAFTINTIVQDDQQQIWVGTEGNGLWKIDRKFTSITQYGTADGFPSMNLISIQPDNNGSLWILSDGGIIKFHPATKEITVFDKSSGIRNPYSFSALTKSPDGNIIAGDMKCVHIFNHSQKIKNLSTPDVLITDFKIFNESYPLTTNKTIELDYNQNYFSFEYVGLNYTQSNRNVYAYMLDGLDKQWNMAGTRRYVSYANLEEGNYTFKVKAANNEGIWNDQPATITVIIHPPFWHRWWFYLLLILFAASAIYAVYYIRQRQLRSKEQLRSKIARDLHDDIGSTLSSINIFSKLALQKVHSDQNKSGELLHKINERSEKTMEALSDIVWSINTRQDDMKNVLAKMLEYLGEVAEPSGIQYEFNVDKSVNNVQVDMEIRKEIYLIFKESINNAVKYAACSLLQVEIKKEQKNLVMVIRDNGKGFNMNNIIPGNGINNMQERASRIKAGIEITSSIGQGTGIRVTLPITRNR
ncbi:MAG: hypothetical protein JST75_20670 [Bacteroidetes bacterium]|nr:hypothetical protein [Bacteroidota bacterium]